MGMQVEAITRLPGDVRSGLLLAPWLKKKGKEMHFEEVQPDETKYQKKTREEVLALGLFGKRQTPVACLRMAIQGSSGWHGGKVYSENRGRIQW